MIAPEAKTQQEDLREMRLKRHREWEHAHPEKVIEYRHRTYANILRRAGYTVIEPCSESEVSE